ncbi:MAG: UDP-N-acetylmuramoyl-tripeptide--D-alanyl-D-alanine ligase [Desulfuromonas sp.]|nr:MAG: UDP-N-acetylmuramoyl-tripeptide--D-alanyl-D-alanine ligase [Desulfuromonas sp.]
MNLDLNQIAKAVGGRLQPATARGCIKGVSIDSRTVQSGELFVPLAGTRVDGHAYVSAAFERGASACLSERSALELGVNSPVIEVADTFVALGDLANLWRQAFDGPVVAITGSAGKTTTREMLAAILARRGEGVQTQGNYNNLIGLPLTVCRLQPQHQWAVLEMGMNSRGEISRLSEIAAPTVGLITNIGAAHLQGLQSIEGVARAKGELFGALASGTTAVINLDDPRVAQLPVANGVNQITCGLHPKAQIRGEGVEMTSQGVALTLILPDGNYPLQLQVQGRHNAANALLATAAAWSIGVDGETIVAGLGDFRPFPGRMELVKLPGGITLIEDSYNANPLSVRAALQALREMPPRNGKRIAVLGDMFELGVEAKNLHRDIGVVAASCCDLLIVMGVLGEEIAVGARLAGMPTEKIVTLAEPEAVAAQLQQELAQEDRVLVKGSRGMRMERVGAQLRTLLASATTVKA